MRLRQVLGGEVERLRDTVRIGLKRKRSFSREYSRCIFAFLANFFCKNVPGTVRQMGKFGNSAKSGHNIFWNVAKFCSFAQARRRHFRFSFLRWAGTWRACATWRTGWRTARTSSYSRTPHSGSGTRTRRKKERRRHCSVLSCRCDERKE